MTKVSLPLLLGDWLVEKGLDKMWKISEGHPHHVLCYQKLIHEGPKPNSSDKWYRGGHAYYMVIEDDKVVDSPSWNEAGRGKELAEWKGPRIDNPAWIYLAADPEFFEKLKLRMEEVMRRIG